jgi:hypothetical protein
MASPQNVDECLLIGIQAARAETGFELAGRPLLHPNSRAFAKHS